MPAWRIGARLIAKSPIPMLPPMPCMFCMLLEDTNPNKAKSLILSVIGNL